MDEVQTEMGRWEEPGGCQREGWGKPLYQVTMELRTQGNKGQNHVGI